MPKISVIIPVYGTENYIERCARSLFEQTLDDIEYLFIDDCTPDRSVGILRNVLSEYPQRTRQVTIHRMEKNSGQAAVRKWGMVKASGEYTIHCDSDDWVDRNLYKSLYENAVKNKADVAICDFAISQGDKHQYKRGCYKENKDDIIRDMCTMKTSWSLCNKIVKTSLIQNSIVFPDDNMGEDMAMMMQIMTKASLVCYVPNVFYYYFDNPVSITRNKNYKQIENRFFQVKNNTDIAINSLEKCDFVKNNPNCLCVMKLNVKRQLLPLVWDTHYYKLWRSSYPETDKQIWRNPYITIKDKIKYALTLMHLYPTRRSRINTR